MIKLSTFNVELNNSLNSDVKVKQIATFILDKFKDLENHIVCIQNISDKICLGKLLEIIRNFIKNNDQKFYFCPDIIDKDINESSNNIKKIEVQNIIISRFKIVDILYAELGDEVNIDDMLGIKTVIAANINVYNNIICVYNSSLSRDIKIANIVNKKAREKEIDALFNLIDKNYENYQQNLQLLVGSFIVDKEDGRKFMKKYGLLDIFRKKVKSTNTLGERTEHLFVIDKMKLKKSDINWEKEIFNSLFKQYGIYFIDYYVRKDLVTGYSVENFPIEVVFMLKPKEN